MAYLLVDLGHVLLPGDLLGGGGEHGVSRLVLGEVPGLGGAPVLLRTQAASVGHSLEGTN